VKIGVLGSGFGVYGYLPAAFSLDWNVATLYRYQESIVSRPELTQFQNRIEYVASEELLLSSCSSIVIARTPDLQFQFLKNYSQEIKEIKHLFLEKPLTSSIEDSETALDFLRKSELSFSLGYLFLHTEWFETISQLLETNGNKIEIYWSIPSPKSSWKASVDLGGGIDSFFLVHFIPVFLKLGFRMSNLKVSQLDKISFLSVLDLNVIEVYAKLEESDFRFEIFLNDLPAPIYSAETPFGAKPKKGVADPRISPLQKYLTSSMSNSDGGANALKVELEVLEFLRLCKA
jgi:hypothetical protein